MLLCWGGGVGAGSHVTRLAANAGIAAVCAFWRGIAALVLVLVLGHGYFPIL
jgi:hypothetical protein